MGKLNATELEILTKMEDHRFVSEPLETAFCIGGLSEFRKNILELNSTINNEYEKLAVMLRGNSDEIIVYKNNHKIWELSVNKYGCKVSFDFNHARYSEKWDKELKKLLKMGFQLPQHRKAELLPSDSRIKIKRNDNNVVTGGEIGVISCTKVKFDEEFVKKSYGIINSLVSDFFKSQPVDYFRKAVSEDDNPEYRSVADYKGSGSGVLVEKRWQQRLLFHFDDMQNGYYAYDLEFSQKFPDSNFVKKFSKENGIRFANVKASDIKEKLCTNEPDMLAIKYEGGNPKALVLIEVKSTESACKGEKSGIKKHMEGMKEYAEQPVFMNKRRIDAYESLLQYQRMKFIPGDVEIKEITEDLPVEKVLLLTNAEVPNSEGGEPKVSALDYLKNNVDAVAKWAKESDCKVWTTCNNYWDDKLDINMNPFGEQKGNC